MHEEMLKVSEEFYQSLKLPYKVWNSLLKIFDIMLGYFNRFWSFE